MGVRRQLRYCTVVVTPIKTGGSLGDAADVQSIPTSPLGPKSSSGWPSSCSTRFQSALQTAATTHLIRTWPRQIQPAIYLLFSDLGTDRIYIYKLDKTTGKLTP